MPRVDAGGWSIRWLAAMLSERRVKGNYRPCGQTVLTDTGWHSHGATCEAARQPLIDPGQPRAQLGLSMLLL